MTPPASTLVCAGCGASPAAGDPYPFRCPEAGKGDIDHLVVRRLNPATVSFPGHSGDSAAAGPFVRYRGLLNSYHRAVAGGVGDDDFLAVVDRLDASVAAVDGHGFSPTPFDRDADVSAALGFGPEGGVWIKDETGNVAGSHKGRHLMGVVLHLEVAELLGQADPDRRRDLAIASCGNAALAAAVVARAGGRRLRVFVPVDADAGIVQRLRDLGADVVICPRRPDVAGDPTYARLREELAAGALPFTCQGNENGLAIEGGETLGYEIATDLIRSGTRVDHLVVQVGGGALASACIQALAEAVELRALERSPRIHTVQTLGAHPLERAYHRVLEHLPTDAGADQIRQAVQIAAGRRSAYMWPWESEPKSMAHGILDDETYDWRAVVEGMLLTGGQPVVVSEDRLAEANRLGRQAGYRVDPTGTAGLAGLIELRAAGVLGPADRVAVLFTGAQRQN